MASAGAGSARAQTYSVSTFAQASVSSTTNGNVKYDGNSATQSITQGNQATVAYSNTPNLPHLTQSTGQISASAALTGCPSTGCVSGTVTASANATADLTTGSIRLMAGGNYIAGIAPGASTATATLSDILTFQVPGASSTTVTNLRVSLQLDGTYSLASASANPVDDVKVIMSVGNGTIWYDFGTENTPSSMVIQNTGWVSEDVLSQTGNSFIFNGVFAVTGSFAAVPVSLQMSLNCQAATCDYSHTGAISFNLGPGVTFTSSSGVFLNRPLAHAADGNNFKTTVLLTNAGTAEAPYALRFDDEQGNIPASGFQLDLGSMTGTIPPGGSTTIRTAGLGPQTFQGWAELSAPPSVAGSVIYSQQTGLPSLQEGTTGVGLAATEDFFVPFDNTNGAVTSMALTNPGLGASVINVTLRYTSGFSETVAYPVLPSRSHQAFEILAAFPNSRNRSGVAEFVASVPLLAVAFRFNSTGGFTAFDVVPATGAAGVITRTLAHAADGNSFKTAILLTNTAATPTAYVLRFDDGQGNLPASGFQLELGSLAGTIPPGQSVTIRTAGLGTQTFQGWAELTAPASVGGSVIYSQQTGLPSLQEGTAAIVASGSQDFFVPFDNTNGAVTSMALTNPGISTASVTVTVRYSDGTSEVDQYPALASRNHQAFEVLNQFPNTFNRSGVVEFVSNAPLSAVVFRFNSTGAFTALGVVTP